MDFRGHFEHILGLLLDNTTLKPGHFRVRTYLCNIILDLLSTIGSCVTGLP